jgi:YQGE family putative transporter
VNQELRRLLLLHSLFLSIVIFSNLFINLFLWTSVQDFRILGKYNLIVSGFIFVGFLVGTYLIRIKDIRSSFLSAIILMLLVFLLLIFKGNAIIDRILPLGFLYGSSLGMYFASYNLVSFFQTGNQDRDLFFGWEQIVNRLISLVTPFLFSILVLWIGYQGAFVSVSLILLVALAFTFTVPRITTDFRLGNLRYQDVWKEYRGVLLSITGFGFIQSWIQIAASVLLFTFLLDETKVGIWNSVFASVGIVMGYWMGRAMHERNRRQWSLVGAALLFLSVFVMLFPNIRTVLIFNVLAVIAIPMIWLPITVVHYNRISDLSCPSVENCEIGLSSHYLVVREFMVNIGRIIFFTLMSLGIGFQGTNVSIYLVFLLALIPFMIYRNNLLLLKQ